MAGLFRSWGFETRLEEFQVLFPTPTTRVVELVAPTAYRAVLSEPPLKEDRTSGLVDEQLPVYTAYSIDGDVTADVVYVNYGVPADYEELERRGIDVKGKIVLARYGGSWRGIKPKAAAERGAVGCLIYSDPREDGYFQGEPYPAGGWRSDRAAQRGSVMDMPVHPGDPLTPGRGATPDAARPARFTDADTLTKIPVLPIAAADALPILRALSGPMAPPAWRGALPLPYRLGPGPARVHLKLAFDWKLVPAVNVIATMRGADLPDQWVVRGNHHDAWVFGAADPVSGMAAVLAEARALGELARTGWRPRRTIVYAGWDGEEQGLLGSTEWAEHHAADLRAKAVAYLNSDSNSRGFLDAGGSHSLERFVNEAAGAVRDPAKGTSVGARLLSAVVLNGSPSDRALARDRKQFELDPLGSGSDYTPFLQHLGVPSLSVGFGGEGDYGQYHSIYDSVDHYVRFMDPDFAYGRALAQFAGRLVLRLADADVLPFEYTRSAVAIAKYAGEVRQLADTMREEAAERARRLDDGVYEAVARPGDTLLPPRRLDAVPYLEFAPLQNAVARLEAAARAFDGAVAARPGGTAALPAPERAALDALLMQCDRALVDERGLPGRPWFRNQVYAPGLYTGYGVKTLPAIREAIEQRKWREAGTHIVSVASTLEEYASRIERAAAALERDPAAPPARQDRPGDQ
jgi:N-acetylated-alpha-linked acidic dipeptidase